MRDRRYLYHLRTRPNSVPIQLQRLGERYGVQASSNKLLLVLINEGQTTAIVTSGDNGELGTWEVPAGRSIEEEFTTDVPGMVFFHTKSDNVLIAIVEAS